MSILSEHRQLVGEVYLVTCMVHWAAEKLINFEGLNIRSDLRGSEQSFAITNRIADLFDSFDVEEISEDFLNSTSSMFIKGQSHVSISKQTTGLIITYETPLETVITIRLLNYED